MISTSTRYQIITKDMARTKALIEKEPVTKREIEYYQANIKSVKTIDAFIKNDRLFKFAMKAYGLEDMAYGKGLMTKLLQEGVSNPPEHGEQDVEPALQGIRQGLRLCR